MIDFTYRAIPTYTMVALKRYIEQRIPTGGFLEAVLSNNLKEANRSGRRKQYAGSAGNRGLSLQRSTGDLLGQPRGSWDMAEQPMSDEAKRRANNRDKVLDLLKRSGSYGATNLQLVAEGGMRYGARIYELRKEGYDIRTFPVESGVFRFVLKGRGVQQVAMFSNESAGVNV